MKVFVGYTKHKNGDLSSFFAGKDRFKVQNILNECLEEEKINNGGKEIGDNRFNLFEYDSSLLYLLPRNVVELNRQEVTFLDFPETNIERVT